MQVENTAAPAGDGARPVDTSLEGVLSRRMQRQQERQEPGQGVDQQAQPVDLEADAVDPASEAEPTADEAEPQPGAEDAPEPEAEPDAEPEAHGNMRTRLRDGTVTTVGELKKAFGELQELKRLQPEITTARQEIEQTKAHLSQRQQQLEQVLPIAVQAIQSAVPPEPPDELWDTDPIEAGRLQRLHDRAKRQRDELVGQAQQAQAEAFQAYVREQQSKLLGKAPELRDPEKAKAFYGDYIAVAEELGFSREEADATHDHRLVSGMVRLWRDAKKWRELQAAKPRVAAKTEGAVPVAAPGRRPAPGEHGNSQIKTLEQRANQSGRMEDVLALRAARASLMKR